MREMGMSRRVIGMCRQPTAQLICSLIEMPDLLMFEGYRITDCIELSGLLLVVPHKMALFVDKSLNLDNRVG